MALYLNNHFLQAEKRLFASFFRHLLIQIFMTLLLHSDTLLLGLLWHVRGSLVTQLMCCSVGLTSGLVRVTLSRSLSNAIPSLLDIATAKWLLLIVLGLGLVLQIIAREVGGLVPSIISSRLVNLAKVILGRIDTIGSILSGITSNITKENGSVLDWLMD